MRESGPAWLSACLQCSLAVASHALAGQVLVACKKQATTMDIDMVKHQLGMDKLNTNAFQLPPKAFPGTPRKVLLLKKVA